jgi:predicted NAD-dependent protein-ADP-ribosyltransferase YbiA (DUF1768 family)
MKDPKWLDLGQIPNWRRVFSSLFEGEPLTIHGLTFKTTEHYLQYCKAKIESEKRAYEFTMDSKSKLGLGSGKDARAARKRVMLTKQQWDRWETDIKNKAKTQVRNVKFAQNTLARRVLLATKDAQLWSVVPRCQAIRMTRLEEFRSCLFKTALE